MKGIARAVMIGLLVSTVVAQEATEPPPDDSPPATDVAPTPPEAPLATLEAPTETPEPTLPLPDEPTTTPPTDILTPTSSNTPEPVTLPTSEAITATPEAVAALLPFETRFESGIVPPPLVLSSGWSLINLESGHALQADAEGGSLSFDVFTFPLALELEVWLQQGSVRIASSTSDAVVTYTPTSVTIDGCDLVASSQLANASEWQVLRVQWREDGVETTLGYTHVSSYCALPPTAATLHLVAEGLVRLRYVKVANDIPATPPSLPSSELPPVAPAIILAPQSSSASPPPVPVLVYPPHGAAVGGSANVPIWVENVPFDWSMPAGSSATTYRLELSSHPAFATIPEVELDGIQPGQFLNLPAMAFGLLPDGTYYWRVRAANAGGSSRWSAARELRIDRTPPTPVVLHHPPSSATSLPHARPTFSWSAVSGAVRYRLVVSYLPDLSLPVPGYENRWVYGNTFTGSSLMGHPEYTAPLQGEFFWAVYPIDAAGNIGDAVTRDSRVHLQVSPPSDALLITSPDGMLPRLEWIPVPGATSYILELATHPSYSSVHTHTLTTNLYRINRFDVEALYPSMGDVLRPGAVIFWRVRVADQDSGYLPGQAFFLVDQPLAAPVVLSPVAHLFFNASPTVHLGPPLLSLNSQAVYAEFEVSRHSHFPPDQTLKTSFLASEHPTPLPLDLPDSNGTLYYWRARFAYQTPSREMLSPFTAPRTFTYDTQPPTLPTLPTLRVSQLRPEIILPTASGAARYTVDLMLNDTPIPVSPTGLSQLRFVPTHDLMIGENTLRVRAYDHAGNASEGQTTVWVDLAQQPTASAVVPASFTFRWSGQPGHQRYVLQVATDPEFQELLDLSGEVLGTSRSVTLPTGAYFWRVFPLNAAISPSMPSRGFYVSAVPLSRGHLRTVADDNTLNRAEHEAGTVWVACDGVVPAHGPLLHSQPYYLELAASAAFQLDRVRVPLVCDGQPHLQLAADDLVHRPFVRVVTVYRDGLALTSNSQRITVDLDPPTTPTRLSPPSGARLPFTLPTLRWQDSAGVRPRDSYRVEFFALGAEQPLRHTYVDTPYVVTSRLPASAFPPLPQVPLEWRVVAVDSAGNEAASVRTLLTLHLGVDPAHHAHLATTTPLFVFQRQPVYTGVYQLIISRDPDLTDWHSHHIVTCGASSLCSFRLPNDAALSPGTSYYWTVVASSSPFDSANYVPAHVHVLAEADHLVPPVLLPIENDHDQLLNATQIADGLTFAWQPPTGLSTVEVVGYELQLSRFASFLPLTVSHVTSNADPTATLPTANLDGEYYWRVRSLLNHGGHTPFSASASFTIDRRPPPSPQLIAPSSSIVARVQPYILWRTTPDAAYYAGDIDGEPFTTTTTQHTPTLAQGRHTLTLRAVDAAGNVSPPIEASFSVNLALSPRLGEIRQGAGASLPVDFVWAAPSGYTGYYTLYLDGDGDFTTVDTVEGVLLAPITTTSRRAYLPHLPEGIYRWWVGMGDELLPADMPVFAFAQTRGSIPSVALHTVAGDDQVNADEDATALLTWQLLAHSNWQPNGYTVEVAATPTFSQTLASAFTTAAALNVSLLNLPDGVYHWRVRTHYPEGFASVSSVKQIVLDRMGPSSAPQLLQPLPNWIVQQVTPTFSWTRPATAVYFRLDILSADGATLLRSYMTNHPQLTLPNHALLPAGTYTWRVQAYDRAGNVSPLSALRWLRIVL